MIPWYQDAEKSLLRYGKWPIVFGLALVIGVSLFFLIALLLKDRYAIPAAAWLVYMVSP